MKTKEKKDLFNKTIPELKLLLKEAKDSLFGFRMEHSKKKLKNTRSIFQKRKDIAKILTVIREKEFEDKNSSIVEKVEGGSRGQ